MSWNARRYNRKSSSKHHVPPKHPSSDLFTMRVSNVDHRAYHTLFGNSGSFEQCVHILWKYWWMPYYQEKGLRLPNIKEVAQKTKAA